MRKLAAVALVIATFALAPTYACASVDPEEIKEACRQAANDEGVPPDESADFIADCIAMNLDSAEYEGAEGMEPAVETEVLSE